MGLRALTWTSAAGLLIFVVIVATQGIGLAGFDPANQQVSEYVHTSAGALMTFGFLAWAVSLLALAGVTIALAKVEAVRWPPYLQAGALVCAGLGAALLGCFPTDRGAEIAGAITRDTAAGEVHDSASALTTAGIFLAAIASAVRFRGSLRVFTLGLVVVALASTAVFLLIGDPLPGIRQRLLLGAGCLWQAVLLWASYRALTSTSPRSSVGSRCSTS
jgi:drug/metabolite transporter (DMT)-like permease